jgi:hypothetical protein
MSTRREREYKEGGGRVQREKGKGWVIRVRGRNTYSVRWGSNQGNIRVIASFYTRLRRSFNPVMAGATALA